jgi:hypothetical protein
VQEWRLRVREGELKGTLGDSHAAIDAGRGWWRLLIHLEADVIEQGRFGEDFVSQGSGMVDLGPPAQKVEQIVGVTAQSGFRNPAHTLLIQKTVAPFHLTAIALDDAEGAAGVFEIATLDHAELHGKALCMSR